VIGARASSVGRQPVLNPWLLMPDA
jgi:hypothetical protein